MQSAIRNLHNAEFKGRTLRVNHAFYDTEGMASDNKHLVEAMSNLNSEQSRFLMLELKKYACENETSLKEMLKARPYLLWSILKLMHRMNDEITPSHPPPLNPALFPPPAPGDALLPTPPVQDFSHINNKY